MSKLIPRIVILSVFLVISAVFFYYEIYLLSVFFGGFLGFLIGVITMKEKDGLKMFALMHGTDIDLEASNESPKKEDS